MREARAAQSRTIAESRRTAITEAVARVAPAVVTVQTETVKRGPVDPFDAFFGGRTGAARRSPGSARASSRAPTASSSRTRTSWSARRASPSRCATARRIPARLLGADDAQRSRGPQDRRPRPAGRASSGTPSDLVDRRVGDRDRQPVRLRARQHRAERHRRRHQRHRAQSRRRAREGTGHLRRHDPDRRVDQPGNSGGPLVNALGEVIGVNSSIYSPSGGSVGLGFAIPINRVKRVAEDLLAHGTIRRPWVGTQGSRRPRPSRATRLARRGRRFGRRRARRRRRREFGAATILRSLARPGDRQLLSTGKRSCSSCASASACRCVVAARRTRVRRRRWSSPTSPK